MSENYDGFGGLITVADEIANQERIDELLTTPPAVLQVGRTWWDWVQWVALAVSLVALTVAVVALVVAWNTLGRVGGG
jgi:hypothetical protein